MKRRQRQHKGPSVGGWIGIGYGTIFLGAMMPAFVGRSGDIIGFIESFAIAFVASLVLWRLVVAANLQRDSHGRGEELRR